MAKGSWINPNPLPDVHEEPVLLRRSISDADLSASLAEISCSPTFSCPILRTPSFPALAAASEADGPLAPVAAKLAEVLCDQPRARELMRALELKGRVTTVCLAYLLGDIEKLSSPATLFREDTIGTRLLAALSNLEASQHFLFQTIVPLVNQVRANPKLYLPDPVRTTKDPKCLQLNAIRSLISSFLDLVQQQTNNCAATLRYILLQVEDAVQAKFPGHSVLSSLFFLRFVCPSIVRCETFMEIGVLSIDERRALVLVTKILQAIANGVDLKEAHLLPLNTFVLEKSQMLKSICSKLIDLPSLQLATIQQLEWRTSRELLFNPMMSPDAQEILPHFTTFDIARTHPVTWSVEQVIEWLDSVDLSDCMPAFKKLKIDGVVLLLLPELGFENYKILKPKRKPILAAVKDLISERTRFFPAYKSPAKWSTDEVMDYLSFMDLSAFSFVIRSLSSKAPLTGSALLRIRNDDVKMLGVDSHSDRLNISDRIMDAILVFLRLEGSRALSRRVSVPTWVEASVSEDSICADSSASAPRSASVCNISVGLRESCVVRSHSPASNTLLASSPSTPRASHTAQRG